MDAQSTAALGGLLVGAAGVFVAGITMWLGYRERTKDLRQRLYERRVDAALELTAAAYKARHEAFETAYIAWYDASHGSDGLWATARSALNDLQAQSERCSVILDAAANTALAALIVTVRKITSEDGPDANLPDVSSEAAAAMTAAYEQVVAALREMLGIEHLSQETLRLLGGPDRQRIRRRPRDEE